MFDEGKSRKIFDSNLWPVLQFRIRLIYTLINSRKIPQIHEKEDGTLKFLTKGDNNPVDDRGLYSPGQLWLAKKVSSADAFEILKGRGGGVIREEAQLFGRSLAGGGREMEVEGKRRRSGGGGRGGEVVREEEEDKLKEGRAVAEDKEIIGVKRGRRGGEEISLIGLFSLSTFRTLWGAPGASFPT